MVDLDVGLGLRQGEVPGLGVPNVASLHVIIHVRCQVKMVGRD